MTLSITKIKCHKSFWKLKYILNGLRNNLFNYYFIRTIIINKCILFLIKYLKQMYYNLCSTLKRVR